jgi:hypothetical protein
MFLQVNVRDCGALSRCLSFANHLFVHMSIAMYLGLKSLTLKSGYRVLLSWSIEKKVLIKERCYHLLQQIGCHQMPQLLRFGFKQQHVNVALIEHKELIRAQD